jgi:signal transduction histidine kinase
VIKRMSARIRKLKIRTKLSLLMLTSAVISLLLFSFLWKNVGNAWDFLCRYPALSWDKQGLIETLKETAKYYDVPESEKDKEGAAKIAPFFDAKDEYTGVYIYEADGDGLYRTGRYPEIMDEAVFGSLMDLGYRVTTGKIEEYEFIPMEFHNGEYNVYIYSYHALNMIYPYLLISVLLSVAVFLSLTLIFINRRMKAILNLKDEILLMASGELEHKIPDCGEDEIGILSGELDNLRVALKENIQQEEESRKANQDLITAISHDLRTPLTILNGYLEVLKLKRIPPETEEEYLDRCLQKTSDIKEMTDKMFEYALVFEESEDVNMTEVSAASVRTVLRENLDFLQLAGFQAEAVLEECTGRILGDETMFKRIFNNLFSNILKYGDKKYPVKLTFQTEKQQIKVTLINTVKTEKDEIDSNRIGLKSVEKMVGLHGGTLYVINQAGVYNVQITFPML